jgi:alkanesulfonate monooxygenase SsuD/methylene tetrahydromethanopterin reductase-like flavin-dependent oxidoreductase (luciferase family)
MLCMAWLIVAASSRRWRSPRTVEARDAHVDRVEAVKELGGTGIWSAGLRYGDPTEVSEAAAELDELGYSALWFPDAGGDVFGAVERLLRATRSAVVATGVLNLWMHSPEPEPRARTPISLRPSTPRWLGRRWGHRRCC